VVDGKNMESAYRKVPSLKLRGNGGRLVNDSNIIVENLVPALYPGSGDDALSIDRELTYGLQLAMEVEGFDHGPSFVSIVGMGGYNSATATFLKYLCCCVLPVGPHGSRKLVKNIRKRRAKLNGKYGELATFAEYMKRMADRLPSPGSLLSGKEAPGCIDVSLYGTLVMWRSVPLVKDEIAASGLQAWWDQMDKLMPADVQGNPKR
jgi:hypothetical protein